MAESDSNEIHLSPAPHFGSPVATPRIMFAVVATLLPIALWGIWLFGFPALVTILTSVASCVGSEALFRLATKRDIRVGDWSAVITGLLLALVLPPSTPVWMTALGGIFSILVAKEFFGGLGANVFNPALSGRAFLMVSFSTQMTTWVLPRVSPFAPSAGDALADAVSAATPLALLKEGGGVLKTAQGILEKTDFLSAGDLYWNLFLGNRAGCIGESAIFLILLAGIVLLAFRVIDWRAPLAMVATAVAVTWIGGVDPLLTLLSGGLLFGAVFMVTDYSTAPVTPTGRLLFGAGCGLITALIRLFGGYPEGVMFSILIMNALSPFLDRLIPRKYGWVRPAKKEKSA